MEPVASSCNILLEITDHIEKKLPKVVTFYIISVTSEDKKWQVERRFSEFDELYKALKKVFPDIPERPPKTAFKLKSLDGILKRKQQLEAFLIDLVMRKEILNHSIMRDFLQLDSSLPEAPTPAPNKIAELGELPLGVRDFIYLQEQGLLFIALSDMNITSRVDAYFNNIKMPWDKKDESVTVGALLAYRVKIGSEYSFERLWVKSYGMQTNILICSQLLGLLALGMDDGKIHLIRVPPDGKGVKHEEYGTLSIHKARVMGLAI